MNPERENKPIRPNTEGLTLTEYFAALPKAERRPVIISAPKEELITEIARQCGKTKMTARRWVYGHTRPCPAEMKVIAGILQCPPETLFPASATPGKKHTEKQE